MAREWLRRCGSPLSHSQNSFLVLFFKKELLPSLLADRVNILISEHPLVREWP
jgi:hypothetical protein